MKPIRSTLLNIGAIITLALFVAAGVVTAAGLGMGDSWIVYPGSAVGWWTACVFGLASLGLWLVPRPSGEDVPSGLCASCGYDLRATPDRCPECGTMPTVTKEHTRPAGGWPRVGK